MHVLRHSYANLLNKGTVFWYKYKKQVFGAVIIEIQNDIENNPIYLVLLSEQLDTIPTDINAILNTKNYTLAWFSEYFLLLPSRIHIVDRIDIKGNYHNKFGLSIGSDGVYCCRNVGQIVTWRHQFSSYSFPNESIREVLSSRFGCNC